MAIEVPLQAVKCPMRAFVCGQFGGGLIWLKIRDIESLYVVLKLEQQRLSDAV
jgi:hypothetical protein